MLNPEQKETTIELSQRNILQRIFVFNRANPTGVTQDFMVFGQKVGGSKAAAPHTARYQLKGAKGSNGMVMWKQGLMKKSGYAIGETITEFMSVIIHDAAGGKASDCSLGVMSDPEGYGGDLLYVGSHFNAKSVIPPIDAFKTVGFLKRPSFAGSLHKKNLIHPIEAIHYGPEGGYRNQQGQPVTLNLARVIASSWVQHDADIHTGNFVVVFERGESLPNAADEVKRVEKITTLSDAYLEQLSQLDRKKDGPEAYVRLNQKHVQALLDLGADVKFEKIDHGWALNHIGGYQKGKNKVTQKLFQLRTALFGRPFIRDLAQKKARPTEHLGEFSKRMQHDVMREVNEHIAPRLLNESRTGLNKDFEKALENGLAIAGRAAKSSGTTAKVGLNAVLRFTGDKRERDLNVVSEDELKVGIFHNICNGIQFRCETAERVMKQPAMKVYSDGLTYFCQNKSVEKLQRLLNKDGNGLNPDFEARVRSQLQTVKEDGMASKAYQDLQHIFNGQDEKQVSNAHSLVSSPLVDEQVRNIQKDIAQQLKAAKQRQTMKQWVKQWLADPLVKLNNDMHVGLAKSLSKASGLLSSKTQQELWTHLEMEELGKHKEAGGTMDQTTQAVRGEPGVMQRPKAGVGAVQTEHDAAIDPDKPEEHTGLSH